MRIRSILAAGAAAGTAGVAALAAPATATPATPAAAARPAADWNTTCADGTRIRASHPDGAVVGLCYRGHSVTVHCYGGDESNLWFYSTDNTLGVTGWIYAGLVDKHGEGTSPC